MNAILKQTSTENNAQELGTVRPMMVNAVEKTQKGFVVTGYIDTMKTVVVPVD